MTETTDKDPLGKIGDELHELEELNCEEEAGWDDIINTDVADIMKQYHKRSMKEIGVIEIIESDGNKCLTYIDNVAGTKQEFEFIYLQPDKYLVGTQFVIYEPKQ